MLKKKLARNELSLGSWLMMGNSTNAEVMAQVGFDWLAIDLEHTSIDLETTKNLIEIYTDNVANRDIFFLLASEFDMEYECVAAQIIDGNCINNDLNKKTNIKKQFINNDWHVPIVELKKSLLGIK